MLHAYINGGTVTDHHNGTQKTFQSWSEEAKLKLISNTACVSPSKKVYSQTGEELGEDFFLKIIGI